MEVKRSEIIGYLEDVKNGRITEGLKTGTRLDDYIRYKQGTFNMILGFDNVGKTYWRMWYYLVISVLHNKKFAVWSGENKAGSLMKNLIQMKAQKIFKDLSIAQIHRYTDEINHNIRFVDNKKMYKFKELLEIFKDMEVDCCLIDPLTGLNRKHGHEANYELLNDGREWVNNTGVSLELCLHPISDASRGRYFPGGHIWEGQIKEPSKTFAEGGQPFASRCDDYYIIHRLPKLESMRYNTLLYVDKIKETETGGQQTEYDTPVIMEYNYGLGFKIGGINPLIKQEKQEVIKPLKVDREKWEGLPKKEDTDNLFNFKSDWE